MPPANLAGLFLKFPGAVQIAVDNRACLIRAVTSMVGELGIDQFIDLGSGLPTADNVHQVAQRADPELRGLIDLDRPVAVIASAILDHVLDSDDPLGVIRAYTAATSFGSCLLFRIFAPWPTPGRPG